MRYHEFARSLNEGVDYSTFVEDDADNHCAEIVASVLDNIVASSDHAEIPKIRLDALVSLVRDIPGAEAFNAESLKMCQQHNDAVGNLIANVKEDENGVKYVYLNREDALGFDETGEGEDGQDSPTMTAPEKTVAQMAKRAASNRG
jgi:hypothetical protein